MYLERSVKSEIVEYRKYFPVLLISGARQVGKSTLALNLGVENYVTLDDINIYEMARNNPKGFVESLEKPVVIDEIQRLPELLISIKEFVDKKRTNGEFVLTGSASLQGFGDISDSLAGRIGIVEIYPFSLKELNSKNESIIDQLYSDLDGLSMKQLDEIDLEQKIISGGYPEIQKIESKKGRYLWFSSYIRTYIESDAKELANIRNMDKFITAYRMLMLRSGTMFNKNDIQREVGLDGRTFDSYFSVLEHTYQIQKLLPYSNNRLKRLIKTPKIYALDSGVLCHLLQIENADQLSKSPLKGEIIESFIHSELLKSNSYAENKANIHYYRTSDKKEIDFILEYPDRIITLEIKSSKSVNRSDFKHIYSLKDELNGGLSKGVVLYMGDRFLEIDEGMFAIPLSFLG